jgi:hypothetical protein
VPHLWAGRFDCALKDIFDLQDDITLRVVGAIAPKLEHAEIVRAMRVGHARVRNIARQTKIRRASFGVIGTDHLYALRMAA